MAAVNFAGGGGGNPETQPERPCRDDLLTQLFASYGATAKIPTLWLYSENDKYFGKEKPQAWFRAFVERGGSGEVRAASTVQDRRPWQFHVEPFGMESIVRGIPGRMLSARPGSCGRATSLAERHARSLHAGSGCLGGKAPGHAGRGGRAPGRPYPARAGIGGGDPVRRISSGQPFKGYHRRLHRDAGTRWQACLGNAAGEGARQVLHGEREARRSAGRARDHRPAADPSRRLLQRGRRRRRGDRNEPEAPIWRAIRPGTRRRRPGWRAYSRPCSSAIPASSSRTRMPAIWCSERSSRRRPAAPTRTIAAKPCSLPPALRASSIRSWRVMSSIGGWRMSGRRLSRLSRSIRSQRERLGKETRDWMLDKTGKTYGKTSYPVWYGPGFRLRDAGRGVEIWHTGSWRRQMPPDAQGPLSETSTFAMRHRGRNLVVRPLDAAGSRRRPRRA